MRRPEIYAPPMTHPRPIGTPPPPVPRRQSRSGRAPWRAPGGIYRPHDDRACRGCAHLHGGGVHARRVECARHALPPAGEGSRAAVVSVVTGSPGAPVPVSGGGNASSPAIGCGAWRRSGWTPRGLPWGRLGRATWRSRCEPARGVDGVAVYGCYGHMPNTVRAGLRARSLRGRPLRPRSGYHAALLCGLSARRG